MNTISVKKGRDANIILAFSALFKVYTLAPGNIISLIKQPKLTTTKMGQISPRPGFKTIKDEHY